MWISLNKDLRYAMTIYVVGLFPAVIPIFEHRRSHIFPPAIVVANLNLQKSNIFTCWS